MLNFVGSVDKAERTAREAGASAQQHRDALAAKRVAQAAVAHALPGAVHWVWSGDVFVKVGTEELQRTLAREIEQHESAAAAAAAEAVCAKAELAAMQFGRAAAMRNAALRAT